MKVKYVGADIGVDNRLYPSIRILSVLAERELSAHKQLSQSEKTQA